MQDRIELPSFQSVEQFDDQTADRDRRGVYPDTTGPGSNGMSSSMATDDSGRQIKSDDEWKARVRAEAAALDGEAAAEDEDRPQGDAARAAADPAKSSRPQIEPNQLPPASVTTLISMFSTQAMVALGMLADPTTGEAELQPALARHFIDLLGVVADKTRGNLTDDESKLLETSLHELRMAFVHMTRQST